MRLLTGSSNSNVGERKVFLEWILAIGDGSVGESNNVDIRIHIPPDLLLQSHSDPPAAIVDSTYLNLLDNINDLSFFQDRAILTQKNSIVDDVNDYMFNLMPGEEKFYLSYDSPLYPKAGTNSPDGVHTFEFLNTIRCC
jgi:ATP-dependent DNA helicase PIF1